MTKIRFILTLAIILIIWMLSVSFAGDTTKQDAQASQESKAYVGSSSCRECHEKFYKLWSTSMHGLAMQPYTPELAKARLTQGRCLGLS